MMKRGSIRVLCTVCVLACVSACVSASALAAEDKKDGTVELFNGKDLAGWKVKGTRADSGRSGPPCSIPAIRASWPLTRPARSWSTRVAADTISLRRRSLGMRSLRSRSWCRRARIPASTSWVSTRFRCVTATDARSSPRRTWGRSTALPLRALRPARHPASGRGSPDPISRPRFDADGKKVANARIEEVVLNDVVIQKDVEVKGPTGGSLRNREAPQGPLMFQGDHGPVAYRHVHHPARCQAVNRTPLMVERYLCTVLVVMACGPAIAQAQDATPLPRGHAFFQADFERPDALQPWSRSAGKIVPIRTGAYCWLSGGAVPPPGSSNCPTSITS